VAANVDALGRTAERTVFDLAGRPLRVESLDGGVHVSVHDAAGRPLERTDARGARALHAYDVLGRPALTWTRDEADAPLRLCERLEYGDGGDVAQDPAVRAFARAERTVGRVARHYDGAGLLSVSGYDLHGLPLSTTRRAISDARLRDALAAAAADAWRLRAFRVDWTAPAGVPFAEHAESLLEADGHTTGTVRDALGRARILVMPADATGTHRVLETTFDPSGALRNVRLDGVPYVEHIACNARGDRTLVAYGNGVMTRCAYDPRTGRLVRLRSERYVRPSAWTFRPAPRAGEAHVLQDVSHVYDLEGNPVRVTDRTPGCGVRGNPEAAAWTQTDPGLAALLASGDALVGHFTYDPLGRLLSATGREGAQGAASPRPWHDAPRTGFGGGGHATPDMENAPALSVLYAEQYAYDFAGNLLSLRHRTGDAAWTRHFGFGGRTPAAWAEECAAHAGGAAWDDAPSNRLTHAGDDDPSAPATHVYDAAGNLVRERGSTRFAWDHAGRLALFARQTLAGGSAPGEDRWAEPSVCALYLYDSAGGRVKKIVRTQGGGVETTVYAGGIFELQRWTRADGTGGACTLHSVTDDQRRIAVVRTGDRHPDDGGPAVQFHLVDALESSTVVTDAAGGWVNREEYLPYGETAFGSFARKRFRFTGKERDGESGLSYHGARY
ncbi:MAG TPA: hypothetical protein VM759_05145, partial [Longimicrobium sp.]|nr:hypothetical protein [Longimicrobium sp.]